MQNYAHIVAELNHGSWIAWFSDAPQLVCEGGDDLACAVAVLIDMYGPPELDWQGIFAIETATRDDHAEFLIPYCATAGLRETASVN